MFFGHGYDQKPELFDAFDFAVHAVVVPEPLGLFGLLRAAQRSKIAVTHPVRRVVKISRSLVTELHMRLYLGLCCVHLVQRLQVQYTLAVTGNSPLCSRQFLLQLMYLVLLMASGLLFLLQDLGRVPKLVFEVG